MVAVYVGSAFICRTELVEFVCICMHTSVCVCVCVCVCDPQSVLIQLDSISSFELLCDFTQELPLHISLPHWGSTHAHTHTHTHTHTQSVTSDNPRPSRWPLFAVLLTFTSLYSQACCIRACTWVLHSGLHDTWRMICASVCPVG